MSILRTNGLSHTVNQELTPAILYVLVASLLIGAASARAASQAVPADPLSKIQTPPQPTVRGVVVSTLDGKPIANVQVKIQVGYNFSAKVSTDEEGRFEFSGVDRKSTR